MALRPWAHGPFELLVHAEGHLRSFDDFDRRIALISFDNAIEVAITTYLSLNPIHRGNRQYPRADVDKWLVNYHTKLDFLDFELKKRALKWKVEREDIIWAHDHRNEQYHGGSKGTPEKRVLSIIRESALWVFSTLFDVQDVATELAAALKPAEKDEPAQDEALDRKIDRRYGMIDLAGKPYYASEVLYAVDPWAYRDVGLTVDDEEGDER